MTLLCVSDRIFGDDFALFYRNPIIPETMHSSKATFITKTVVLQRFATCFDQLNVNITVPCF